MHRIFCSPLPAAGETAAPDAREREHLFRVLRAAPGQEVELLDGSGGIAVGRIVPGREIQVTEVRRVPEPRLKLHLVCALPRRQKLDQMLKQAAELGAWSIRPLKCVRSVAGGDPRERWEQLLREACKQSGNPFLPRLMPEERVVPALARLRSEGIEAYYGSVIPGKVPTVAAGAERALLIGPEGGFAPEELEALRAHGARPYNFAPHILRLETAAVCGLTALRLLGAVLLAALTVTLTGCDRGRTERNPLLLKGARLRDAGDAEAARRFFRRAVAAYPDQPEAYLALAQLCDEYLNDPLEALYCYRNYLQLTRSGTPEYEAAARIAAHLERQTAEKFSDGGLARENAALKRRISELTERAKKVEKMMVSQQLRLVRLNDELAAERRKNSGRMR